MTRWGIRRTGMLLASTLALGCSGGEQSDPVVDGPLPPYAATTLQGDTVSVASLKGKVVLLNLWATWCAPCRHETPFLESLYKERSGQGLEIVGVSMDTGDARDQVQSFIQEFGVTYRILVDPQMKAMDTFQVLGLPATFLIDRDGVLRWMRFGPVGDTDKEFMTALETTLQ